jgi:hypothetical protein
MRRAGEDISRAGDEIRGAMHEVGDELSRAFGDEPRMTRRERKAERRRARWEARRARRAERRKTGPFGWAACYWWLIFPLLFAGPALLESLAEEWSGLGASMMGGVEGLMRLSPAGPVAELMTNATGLSFLGAFGLLAAAGAVAAGAAVIALKAPRTRPSL